MAESLKFAHRKNLDGTVDSICPRCAATVATVYVEGELLMYEQQHVCDPALMELYHGRKSPSSETVEDSENSQFAKLGKSKL
ncbi:MAG: hypothetical protein WBX19_20585 [Terracidiphilus sp.]